MGDKHSENDSKPRVTRTDSDVKGVFVRPLVAAKVAREKFTSARSRCSWRQLVHGREYVMTSMPVVQIDRAG